MPFSSRLRFFEGSSSPPRSSVHSRLRLDRTALGARGARVTPAHLGLVPETVPVAAARAPRWVVWCSCMSGRPTCPCKGPASFLAKAVPLGQSPLSTQSCWEARGAKPVLSPPAPAT